MAVERSRTGIVAGAALLAAIGLIAFAMRTGGDVSVPDAEGDTGITSGSLGAGTETSGVSERELQTSELDAQVDGKGDEGRSAQIDPTPEDAPGRIDVLVRDRAGAGLLDPVAAAIPSRTQFWLRVKLIEGSEAPERAPASATTLLAHAARTSSETGWYTNFPRPDVPSCVALCFGEHVLTAESIAPQDDKVILVFDLEELEGLLCTVRGVLPPSDSAGASVRVRPLAANGIPMAPIMAEEATEDRRFEIRRIPPGRAILEVGVDQSALTRAILDKSIASGVGSISFGSRAVDRKQWDFRIRVLAGLAPPFAAVELNLVPGEILDLGNLPVEPAAACSLAFVDARGRDVDARSVDIVRVHDGSEAPAKPVTWTFDNWAFIFPLPQRPIDFAITQGPLGAIVQLQPKALGSGSVETVTEVVLRRMSLVRLPKPRDGTMGPAPRGVLTTSGGGVLRPDPRWEGGAYHGFRLDGSLLLVPPGAYEYRSDAAVGTTLLSVGPGTLVDLSVDPFTVRELPREDADRGR